MSFSDFWSVYPKRVEKIYAQRCFQKSLSFATEQEIIDGAKKYAAHCLSNNTDRQYIKNPSTWLNKGCWGDDYDIPMPVPVSSEESRQRARVEGFYKTGYWQDSWGAIPKPRLVKEDTESPQLSLRA